MNGLQPGEPEPITKADIDALVRSLKSMIKCYGGNDGFGPIGIITDAVRAVRRVHPKFKFEAY